MIISFDSFSAICVVSVRMLSRYPATILFLNFFGSSTFFFPYAKLSWLISSRAESSTSLHGIICTQHLIRIWL